MAAERNYFVFMGLLASAALVFGFFFLVYWLRERAWSTFARRHGFMRAIQADTVLGRMIESPLVTGEYEGCSVHLTTEKRSTGRNSSVYTVLQFYPGHLSHGATLSREHVGKKLAKAFGQEEEQLGSSDFDRRVFVEGLSPHDRHLLSNTNVQLAFIELFTSFPGARLQHGMLKVELHGHVGSLRTLERMLRSAGGVAVALRMAAGGAQRVA